MEITSFLRAGVALGIVLGLIALVAYLARRFGLSGHAVAGRGERRLSVVETMTLDPKRRVLLIKCDEHEHLILLGATSETVLGAAERPRFAALESAASSAPEIAQPGLSPASLRAKAPTPAPEHKSIPKTSPGGRLEPQLTPPASPRETR